MGAIVGAVVGLLVMAPVVLLADPRSVRSGAGVLGWSAAFGGALGFVLAPLAAWTLMRHVPIWRAIAETALGTTIGAVVGFGISAVVQLGLLAPIALALFGFVVAAVRLRVSHPRGRRSVSVTDASRNRGGS
ncbi:MAG TPA: hypothetical protein VJ596_00900 [Gemmatimonadaceae bacterium]|nr:hypothetical protein [Gemmatimonadaceae bacterium]